MKRHNAIKDILISMRLNQLYKNLVIFLPILFAEQIFNIPALFQTILGFFSLFLISSASYILNDVVDIKRDKLHSEKKLRPIAAGRITIPFAILFFLILAIFSILLTLLISREFTFIVIILFCLMQAYTLFLKRIPFLDVILIAVNFVIRSVSGAFVITQAGKPWLYVSPWLILCPFFLSLFLSIGKRNADMSFLGKQAVHHKPVLGVYTEKLTKDLMLISTTLLILSYSLYSFLSTTKYLLATLPFAIYFVFRYLHLVDSGSPIARNPSKIYKDKSIFIGLLFWLFAVFAVLFLT